MMFVAVSAGGCVDGIDEKGLLVKGLTVRDHIAQNDFVIIDQLWCWIFGRSMIIGEAQTQRHLIFVINGLRRIIEVTVIVLVVIVHHRSRCFIAILAE